MKPAEIVTTYALLAIFIAALTYVIASAFTQDPAIKIIATVIGFVITFGVLMFVGGAYAGETK